MQQKLLIFLILCFCTQLVIAKKLYKYQDEEGRWFYSDKPPVTEQEVEVRQLKASPKRYIWLQKSGNKHSPEYYAINKYNGPVEIDVRLEKNVNVRSIPNLPKRFVVDSGNSETLFKFEGVDKYKSWSYGLKYRYMIGSPEANHRQDAVYLPPFAKNTKFFISQAFAGDFSHTDKQNYYAVDIVMPVDTAIHAARSGKVMDVNNDYFKSGTTQAFKNRANSIRILHDDGSMAIYAHLALEKAQVHPGLKVEAGQLIGYSGNTGYSTGPHLHFAVQVNKGMALESVPFIFKSIRGSVKAPKVGTWLQN